MNPNDLTLDDFEKEMPPVIPISQVITALLNNGEIFPATYLQRFSDLLPEDARSLAEAWPHVSLERRQTLMEDLQALAAEDYLLSFESVGRLALTDADPLVRFGGIQTLVASECTAPDLANRFLDLLETDADEDVRTAAASALGAFVYAGEIGKLSPRLLAEVEKRLLDAYHSQPSAKVRRCVLESLGFSSRPEVPGLIRKAVENGEEDWQAAALFAIARSADDAWASYVLAMLKSPVTRLSLEAIRAAGELELKEARPILISLIDHDDLEVRLASFWALSQIGGRGVREVLQSRLEAADEDEVDFLEEALENLAFTDGENDFSLFDVTPDDLFPEDELLDDELSDEDFD